jgi:TnpA family transposase
MALRWRAIDAQAGRFKRNLRPLFLALEFTSTVAESPWLAALTWMKQVFSRSQSLAAQPLSECPEATVPKRLGPYLWTFDANGKATGLRGDRYEFWIYRQIRKRFEAGELYLDDSLRHRRLNDELVSPERQREVFQELDLAWVREPIDTTLDRLCTELRDLWRIFDRELRRGQLKHLDYDPDRKTLAWRRPKAEPESDTPTGFFAQLPARGIADIFRFVDERCQFLQALTPLQPRYAKKIADPDSLMAVILAQAMNHGNPSMAETSDIPYHVLEATHQQYLRLSTLRAANDRISNAIAELSIFPHYSFDLEILYGSVDGQKFEAASPTVKARHSRKYFGTGKGVVAYTLLANHVPLHSAVIGAHEHESHYVFDVYYQNTSNILPTAITGDMHSVNKANFAILRWFGSRLQPRFTNLQAQLKHLYAGHDPEECARYLIPPVGQIDRALIVAEKANLDQIVATLALKDMTQSTLIRKLCTYSGHHRTRRALFEFDRLIRSLYTLQYLRDPQLQRNVHRSQNRIEAYHQLRAVLAQIGGRKQLIGRTDLDVAISNECGRLLANVVIAYNSILLSALLDRYQAAGNLKALARLKKISPVAWQHIHFLGQYTFRGPAHPIDLEDLLAGVHLG